MLVGGIQLKYLSRSVGNGEYLASEAKDGDKEGFVFLFLLSLCGAGYAAN